MLHRIYPLASPARVKGRYMHPGSTAILNLVPVHGCTRPYRCTRVGNSTVDLSIDLPRSYIRVRLHAQDLNLDLQRCTHPAVCVHTHTGRSTDLPDMYKAVCVHTHLLFFVFSNKKKSTPSPRLNCVIIEFSSNLFSVKGVLEYFVFEKRRKKKIQQQIYYFKTLLSNLLQ